MAQVCSPTQPTTCWNREYAPPNSLSVTTANLRPDPNNIGQFIYDATLHWTPGQDPTQWCIGVICDAWPPADMVFHSNQIDVQFSIVHNPQASFGPVVCTAGTSYNAQLVVNTSLLGAEGYPLPNNNATNVVNWSVLPPPPTCNPVTGLHVNPITPGLGTNAAVPVVFGFPDNVPDFGIGMQLFDSTGHVIDQGPASETQTGGSIIFQVPPSFFGQTVTIKARRYCSSDHLTFADATLNFVMPNLGCIVPSEIILNGFIPGVIDPVTGDQTIQFNWTPLVGGVNGMPVAQYLDIKEDTPFIADDQTTYPQRPLGLSVGSDIVGGFQAGRLYYWRVAALWQCPDGTQNWVTSVPIVGTQFQVQPSICIKAEFDSFQMLQVNAGDPQVLRISIKAPQGPFTGVFLDVSAQPQPDNCQWADGTFDSHNLLIPLVTENLLVQVVPGSTLWFRIVTYCGSDNFDWVCTKFTVPPTVSFPPSPGGADYGWKELYAAIVCAGFSEQSSVVGQDPPALTFTAICAAEDTSFKLSLPGIGGLGPAQINSFWFGRTFDAETGAESSPGQPNAFTITQQNVQRLDTAMIAAHIIYLRSGGFCPWGPWNTVYQCPGLPAPSGLNPYTAKLPAAKQTVDAWASLGGVQCGPGGNTGLVIAALGVAAIAAIMASQR